MSSSLRTALRLPILVAQLLSAAAVAHAQVRDLTVQYQNGGPSVDGWASASAAIRYGFLACDGELWVTMELVRNSIQPSGNYWYQGKSYPAADLPETDYQYGSYRVAGDVMRPPNVRVASINYETHKGWGASCFSAVNHTRLGSLSTLIGPQRTKEQTEQYLSSLYFSLRPAPALRSSTVESHIKYQAQKAVAEAQRAQRDRETTPAQTAGGRQGDAGTARSGTSAGASGSGTTGGSSGTGASNTRDRSSTAAAPAPSTAASTSTAVALLEGAVQLGSMIQQARAEAKAERERKEQLREEALARQLASAPDCDPSAFQELNLDYSNRGTIDGTECRLTASSLGDGYRLTMQREETIRFSVTEGYVAVLLNEAGREVASTSGPAQTLKLSPARYVVHVFPSSPDRHDSYFVSVSGTSRYISVNGERVVRPRRLVTCAEAVGATDTLTLGSTGTFQTQETGCDMALGRYVFLWVDKESKVEIEISSSAHSGIFNLVQVDGSAYVSGGYLDGEGRKSVKEKLPRGLYSMQVILTSRNSDESPAGTSFTLKVGGKPTAPVVMEPATIAPLGATVTAIRFYAAADSQSIDPAPRSAFPVSTRYVVPELEFRMPPASGSANLVCSILDKEGMLPHTVIGRLAPAAGAVSAKWVLGPLAPLAGPGKWNPGTYRLFCAVDTEKERETTIVARGSFVMTP